MQRGNGSRILSAIILLVVIAIAIAALVSIGRAIFGGDQNSQPDVSREALLNTSVGHGVRMTVRGKLVANENFRSYQIIANANERTMTTYSGYLEQPIEAKQYANNTAAYDELVHALERAGMVKATAFTDERDDTRGVCATGRVYEFEVIEDGKVIKRLWASSCKNAAGSLKVNAKNLQTLFLSQIPENQALLKNIKL